MAGRPSFFSRIRLKYRHSSTTLKCILLITLVVCIVALLALRVALMDAKAQQQALAQEQAQLEQENSALEDDIAQLGTIQSIKELAAKLFGLVDPDSVVFLPE